MLRRVLQWYMTSFVFLLFLDFVCRLVLNEVRRFGNRLFFRLQARKALNLQRDNYIRCFLCLKTEAELASKTHSSFKN
jgi:hypothetical protein